MVQLIKTLLLFFLVALSAPSLGALEIKGKNVLTKNDFLATFPDESKGTVVVFLSSKCPCSASHEKILKDLALSAKNFRFIGIHSNTDENEALTEAHFKEAELPFQVIQDDNAKLANHLGAIKTPHTFVFNNKGELVYQGGVTDSHIGPQAKKQFLKEVIEDIQAGVLPRHKEGRTLGCYIQRGDE